MSDRRALRILLLFLLLMVNFHIKAARAQEPAVIPVLNPLAQPAPFLSEPLMTPLDLRPPDHKLLGGLWKTMAPAGEEGPRVPVIITLHPPIFQGTEPQASSPSEPTSLKAIAALEHAFVQEAAAMGFQARAGLSHFPIVFGDVPAGQLLNVANLSWVRTVEEQRTYQITRVEGNALIRADRLRNQFGGRGAGIGIGVLDSGIDAKHPEFSGRVVAGADYTQTTPWNGFVDDNGHGTNVAGIIAGNGGVAPQARLWAGKVLTAAGQGHDIYILTALNSFYAYRHEFGGLHVINMSLGGGGPFNGDCDGSSGAYTTLFNALTDVGVIIFVASGNEGCSNGVAFPACLSRAVSVGAVYDGIAGSATFPNPTVCRPSGCSDSSLEADKITCYSNSGAPLDILAPSHCATTPNAGGGYNSCFGGTSAASPYAAGVAAQLLSLLPSTSPSQLVQALTSTGRSISHPSSGLSRRRIDALSAYQHLSGGPEPSCTSDASTLCIDDQPGDHRFKVQVPYQTTLGGGKSGFARAIPLASLGVSRGGLFWFFSADNPEMLIKVLNGCSVNGRFWIFYAAGTSAGFTVRVTDTYTGVVWERTNPDLSAAEPIQDTFGFTCSTR